MFLDYIELELDAVEERGAGRVPQEMAKSAHGSGSLPTWDQGIPQTARNAKEAKTLQAVGTRSTQVLRKE